MNGFFKNVGARYEGLDFVTSRRNWRDSIHGYRVYVCIMDKHNGAYRDYSYLPTYDYYQPDNKDYDDLEIRIDIQKVQKDFKLLNLSGLNKYQTTIAFLNFIAIITDGDSNKIVEFLNEYSNYHKWYVKKETKTTLSYGPTKEIVLGERKLEEYSIFGSNNTDIMGQIHPVGITINLTKE